MLVALLSSTAIGGAALAQETPDKGEPAAEITVTARKFEERLLDVPVTVTALTAAKLEDRNVVEMRQLIDVTPGLYFQSVNAGRSDRSVRQLGIRGVVPTSDLDSEQGASVFIDGAPMNGGALSNLEDAERIEILRGPQSAYFGRSTFSGAINFVSRTPSNEFQGKVIAEVGSYGTTQFGGQIEGPIIKDVLRARIAVNRFETEGQYRAFNDRSQRIGARKTLSASASVYFQPSDTFDAKLRVAGWNDDDGPSPSFAYGFGNGQERANCRVVGATRTLPNMNGTNNWFCGGTPPPTRAEINGDFVVTPRVQQLLDNVPDPGFALQIPYKSFIDGFGLARRAREVSLAMNWEFAEGYILSSISAYHKIKMQTLDDIDRRANGLLGGTPLTDSVSLHSRLNEDYSTELRLTSPRDKRLRGMVGASYYNLDYAQTTGFILRDIVRSLGFGALATAKTWGVFGAVEFDLTDQLTIAAEARRQWDTISKASPDGSNRLRNTFKSFTPRFHIDWKINPDAMLFASYAKGVKPGTFNPSIASYTPEYIATIPPAGAISVAVAEEKITQYELGFKGSLFDRRLNIQAAAYYTEWRPQVSVTTGAITLPNGTTSSLLLVANTGRVNMWGIELEGSLRANDWLTFEGTFNWNDSENKSLPCSNCLGVFGEGLEGKRYSASPEFQASASANLTAPLTDIWSLYVRPEWTYQSRVGSVNENMLDLFYAPSRHRVNLRLGAETDNLRIEGYVTNLFNDDTVLGIYYLQDYAFFGTTPARQMLTGTMAEKRTFGLRASYKF